jgi:polyphosphate kinase 2 (PPK2 family)
MPFGKRGWSKSEILRNILPKMEPIVLKFFLHISKRSRERLLRRLEEKNKLFSVGI